MGFNFHLEEVFNANDPLTQIPEIPEVVTVPEAPEGSQVTAVNLPEAPNTAEMVIVPEECEEPEEPKTDLLEKQLDAEIEKPEREYKSSEVARENSRKWHQMWVKKGVPRAQNTTKGKEVKGASSAKNLAKAKGEFISKWIQECGMPPSNDRRNGAIKAWMASSERSNFMAGSQGIQK